MPGAAYTVADRSPAYGVTLRRPGQQITLSPEVAELLWGEVG